MRYLIQVFSETVLVLNSISRNFMVHNMLDG